ncbi:hypothetical protein D3C86_2198130 [compost metagenome]
MHRAMSGNDQRIAGLKFVVSGHVTPGNESAVINGHYFLGFPFAPQELDFVLVRKLVEGPGFAQ